MGQLPVDESLWQELDTITNLNLANNDLSGLVPAQISQLTSLHYLSLAGNRLTGAARMPGDACCLLRDWGALGSLVICCLEAMPGAGWEGKGCFQGRAQLLSKGQGHHQTNPDTPRRCAHPAPDACAATQSPTS